LVEPKEATLSRTRCAALAVFVAAAILALGQGAGAQEFPNRTITLIVPFPPGGGNDAMARIMADRMSTVLGHTVVVDNRGGAGGLIGTRAAIKAPPDGYTLLLGHTGSIGINPTLYAHAGFDPRKDFAPIGLIAKMPLALIAHPSVPAKTVAELIAMAKKEPGKVILGSSSKGTGSHMCAEMFMQQAGVRMNLVPYKGTGQLLNDLIGGHVQVAFNIIPPAYGNIKAGKLRALAVTSATRSPLMPEVPTAAESGLSGFEVVLNYGILAPAGTPAPIVTKLNAAMRVAIANEDVKKRISADGAQAVSSTPAEYTAIVDKDEREWGALIKKLGLKVE
jgi:tripartite-type tricarboxylate transporter receptor subunit TctC